MRRKDREMRRDFALAVAREDEISGKERN